MSCQTEVETYSKKQILRIATLPQDDNGRQVLRLRSGRHWLRSLRMTMASPLRMEREGMSFDCAQEDRGIIVGRRFRDTATNRS